MNNQLRLARTQRGIAVIWGVLFIIVGSMLTLTQLYDIAGSRSASTMQQTDSTAAFFGAESGLQAAVSRLSYAGDPFTACDNLGTVTNAAIPGATIDYSGTARNPSGCNFANTTCECQVSARVTAGGATRTLTRGVAIIPGTTGGSTCSTGCLNQGATPNWKIIGYNSTSNNAIALIHLAAGRQGSHTGATCPASDPWAATCTNSISWAADSSSGNNSILSQGHTWLLAPGGNTGEFWTVLNQSQPSQDERVAVTGVLFPATSGSPSIVGIHSFTSGGQTYTGGGYAYWDDVSTGNNVGTIGKNNDVTGKTNDGTVGASTPDCVNPLTNDVQACNKWCNGGDRLVVAVSVNSTNTTGTSDRIGSVTFHTAGTAPQNIALARVNHFPTTGPQNYVYSEIWSAYNPNYLSNADATSGGVVTAKAGIPAANLVGSVSNGSTSFTVTNTNGNLIFVGDQVINNADNTILGTVSCVWNGTTCDSSPGASSSSAGTYQITASSGTSSTIRIASKSLQVSAFVNGWLSVGDTLSATTAKIACVPGGDCPVTATSAMSSYTSQSSGAGNHYTLDNWASFASASVTANGYTIHVTGGTVPVAGAGGTPPAGTPVAGTLLNVRSGTGQLSPKSCVANTPSPSDTAYILNAWDTATNQCFTDGHTNPAHRAATPTTRLNGTATLCGGTCAFFDHTANTKTSYTIAKPDSSDYWASGLMCLSGADGTPQIMVFGTTTRLGRWRENVQ